MSKLLITKFQSEFELQSLINFQTMKIKNRFQLQVKQEIIANLIVNLKLN